MFCWWIQFAKTGWRKISFYFNISYEIKDKTIEFDDNRNVQRAEFIVRAHMQYASILEFLYKMQSCFLLFIFVTILFLFVCRGGRFSDGWGSCEKREKRFLKPNHDIPSTAETRAKNKACQVNLILQAHVNFRIHQCLKNEKSLFKITKHHLGVKRRFTRLVITV